MFNLIRRDLILQKRQLLIFAPFVCFFIFMNSHPALIFLIASVFIPLNTYAYDEKAETNILLNSLPYTRKEIIASRYVGAVVYMVLSIGFSSLALFIFNKPFTVTDMAIGSSLFLLFAALTFPLFYILKPGYISTVVIIGFIVTVILFQAAENFLAQHLTAITEFVTGLSTTTLYAGSAVAVLTLYAVSWIISSVIYFRKAF
ncbi:ABC-2 transporter permease [Jeotgalibacillus proteolyticus]|uniref:ABC-2 transporter permease n=1 Tax=Jeotgalibacillus proteolyticus TaxID=2082395 RepID=A0A2S5GDN4_9BACL|nr:ABC-2 transporter permease [Jeotgalibacillus proteolyticus]PPA71068.1 ABC-2 transporter permease [Jeotgalibacillus proteolyticus]